MQPAAVPSHTQLIPFIRHKFTVLKGVEVGACAEAAVPGEVSDVPERWRFLMILSPAGTGAGGGVRIRGDFRHGPIGIQPVQPTGRGTLP